MRLDLERIPIAGEEEAEERSWQVVARAYAEHEPRPPQRRRGRSIVIALATVAVGGLIAVAVSPAGSEIVRSVREAVGLKRAAPALTQLPTGGRLLVTSAEGPWVVQPDGSKRLLGGYTQASWSPHGLFVAVTSGHQLLAVDPRGIVHWSLARPDTITLPRWSPDGYRIAYFDGGRLRIINGDSTGDRPVAGLVAHVAAAWRPSFTHQHVLAYVTASASHGTRRARLVVFDADTHELYSDHRLPADPSQLLWSSDGQRLVALSAHGISVFDRDGKPLDTIYLARRAMSAALAPGTHQLAVILSSSRSDVVSFNLDHPQAPAQEIFNGAGRFSGLAWSPHDHWLLVAWPTANQWLFIRTAPKQRIAAVASIASQFNPGRRRVLFPTLDGWCCTP